MGLLFKNNAETTLSSGINDAVTTVPVTSAAVFPTPDANNVFFATLDDGTNIETVKVTGISSNDLTVVRAQDNTSAAAFGSGAKIELRLNAKVLEMGTSSLTDLDGDTKVMVEESSDEDKIRFDTGGTERAIIDSTGLGIGTSSPFSKTQITETGWSSGAPYGTVLTVTGNNTNDANWGHLIITDSSTGTGNGGMLRFAVGSTSSDISPHAGIDGFTEGSNYGGLKFLTRANGGTAAERIRITSDGKVGIHSTDPATDGYDYAEDLVIKAGSSTNSDGAGLSIQNVGRRYGVIAFGDSASVHSGEIWYDHTLDSFNMRTAGTHRFLLDSSGNATYTGNVTAYGSVSDERLKENIEVIENPIEKIKDLKGVTFTYKKDGQKSTGLIAQDLEKVLPEAVYTTETVTDEREGEESEEHLAIRYGNTVGLLVEAIKELEARVKELEGK